MKLLSILTLLTLASCGAVQNSCDMGGYNELCYGLLGDSRDGADGAAGADGSDGKDGTDGASGKDGTDGSDGSDGKDGADGDTCIVTENANGASITCGANTVQINHGNDSVQSPYAIEELIDPCGDYPGYADEIIIKTYSGALIAYFEDGGKRFLASLAPGNYKTTDKQKCNFTVTTGFEIEEN